MTFNPLSQTRFGFNPDVGTSEVDIWTGLVQYVWPQAAEPLRIRAGGDLGDDVAGAGARTIHLQGLDDDFNVITAELDTAGAAQSAQTLLSFRRLLDAHVGDAGTYGGNNIGNVIIENTSGNMVGCIAAGLGKTQLSMFTVPKGHVGYIKRVGATVAGGKTGDLFLWERMGADVVAAPYSAKLMLATLPVLEGTASKVLQVPLKIPELTDVWWSAIAAGNNTEIAATYDIEIFESQGGGL